MAHVKGDKVRAKIKDGLEKLATQYGKNYVYSPSELSRLINVSRPTLYLHASYIDEILESIKAERKQAKGHGIIEYMRERMAKMEQERDSLKRELNILRQHHGQIYQRLYYEGKNISAIVKPVVMQESIEQNQCILCGQELTAGIKAEINKSKRDKVVNISARRGGKEKTD